MSCSNARFSPASVTSLGAVRVERPERAELVLRVHDPEQVVDAIVERIRVALEVEEQVAGIRLGQGGEAAFGLDARRRRQQQLVDRLRQATALDLDAGLLAHALDAGGTRAVERGIERDRRRSQPLDRVELTGDQRLALPRGDPGHQGEVVVVAAANRAELRPSAHPAMLDRLGIGGLGG